MSREAMKQALEALEQIHPGNLTPMAEEEWNKAITALRQALETEQKPVAWASSLDFDDDDQEIIAAKDKGKLGTSNCDIPLYTSPPKREWVGLHGSEVPDTYKYDVMFMEGWLWAEERLKEKNT